MLMDDYEITESRDIDVKGGYLIDGFPSVTFANAITTESIIHTSKFEAAGVIDSENFPAVSLIENGVPNYPTRIFVNESLKVAIFSSFLAMHRSMYRSVAKMMLTWAVKHDVSHIISSAAMKEQSASIAAVATTETALNKLVAADIPILSHGVIPGIPGALLNQGKLSGQNVTVLLFNETKASLGFEAGVELCNTISKIVPGVACNIPALEAESKKAEKIILNADKEARRHRHMYH